MALGLYPEFQDNKVIPGWDTEGVLMVDAMEILDEVAQQNGVKPLFAFNGQYAEIPEDYDGDPSEFELPPEKWAWFDPSEGLATVDVLLSHLKAQPEIVSNTVDLAGLINELEPLRSQLSQAIKKNVRFQLCMG